MDLPRHTRSAGDLPRGSPASVYRTHSEPIRRPKRDRHWPAPILTQFEEQSPKSSNGRQLHAQYFFALMLGSVGVVFGDIGTSPLYTFSGIFVDVLRTDKPTPDDITGTFSMIFWVLSLVVGVKYVCMVMRVNHHGEGGTFALMHTILSSGELGSAPSGGRATGCVTFLALLGCAFIIGDGCITPVISVLGALEGIPLDIGMTAHVLIAVVTLMFLFGIQSRGSHMIGFVAGPMMVCWFLSIASLGFYNLVKHPGAALQVMRGLSPAATYRFWTVGAYRGVHAWHSLAGVVLSVTGAEALYADMGHFGALPISAAWISLVYPCLVLQYMGQAAALCVRPEGVSKPFYNAIPDVLQWPMVVMATLAAIIASQALISGVFSLLTQAVALKFLPRIMVLHTNPHEQGQVYVPEANWALCCVCIAICIAFQSSNALAGAYGIAVTSTFLVTTALLWFVARWVWHWRVWSLLLVFVPMFIIDAALWSANAVKIAGSGWVPVVISVVVCVLMHTHLWAREREEAVMAREARAEAEAMKAGGVANSIVTLSTVPALQSVLRSSMLVRTDKAAIFMTHYEWRVPHTVGALATLLGCLPKTIVLLSIHFERVPFVAEDHRASLAALGEGVFTVVLHFGYAEPLTAKRLAIYKGLASVGREHRSEHPALAALMDLGEDRNCTPDGGSPSVGNLEHGEDGIEEGGPRESRLCRPTPHARVHGPMFVLHKLYYAIYVGEHGLLGRARIALYSFMVRNARQPISFFGLEAGGTMEVSVVRFI